ncbi:alpha/beta fold hydrolase [Streptomyces sp. NPDC002574]|uniref:alpha/beta fold hydrolase n=1 Tax=Streptomyces sp. NPDC002574 TaxID=3364652 RepID=UPI00367D9F59
MTSGVFDLPKARHAHFVRSADGTSINVEEYGSEPGTAPTVVLIHGWTCNTRFWAPLIHELAGEYRVVAYDQRGHGRSGTPHRDGYSTDALADDLTAVLESVLPADEKAVLVGHSMGGMTAMAAGDRPAIQSRTAAVLLASTGSGRLLAESLVLPPRVRAKRVRDGFHRFLLISAAPLGPQSAVTRAALKYGILGPDSSPELVAATARIVHACGRRQRAAWGRVLAGLNLDAGVAALRVPTAVLVGTDDKLTPPVHARGLAARLSHFAGLTELPGLGHMTPLEAPAAVAGVVRTLITDHLRPQAQFKEESA